MLSLDLKIDPEGGGTGFRILSQLDTGEQFSLSYTQSSKYIQVAFFSFYTYKNNCYWLLNEIGEKVKGNGDFLTYLYVYFTLVIQDP